MSYKNRLLAAFTVAATLGACSSGRGGNGDGGRIGQHGDGSANQGDGGPGGSNCATGAELVYLVDENNALFSFAPDTLTFTEIGPLHCQAQDPSATPFSMGVDRNAVAWVLYSDGEMFQVSTGTAACTSTSFQSDQDGFQLFGMGFAADSSGSMTDTLYIAGGPDTGGTSVPSSSMLGTLSFPGLAVNQVGTVKGQPELTGSGAGDLWSFAPTKNSSTISKLDKTSGTATTSYPVATNKGEPMAWAFAFWGGDLWAFLQTANDNATVVYQVDGMTGALKASTPTTNRIIVGAGVSTCAPIAIQ